VAESLQAFVARRRPDWDTLKRLLEQERAHSLHLEQLHELDRLYRRAAADLAHAQAFFPGTDVPRFLNQLCAQAYGRIYRPPGPSWAALRRFFREGFPRAVQSNLRPIAASALLFVLGIVLGGAVAWIEPEAASGFVPESVRTHVAEKRLWTDDMLTVAPPGYHASRIATNNLTVTITAFAGGLTFGLLTSILLLYNGLLLGGVASVCIRGGMGHALLDFVSAHGFVELTVIVLAGGAGLMLAQALVAPGELPRAQALTMKGRDAVRIVLGCAPFLGAIGIVEGFVSPGSLFSSEVKLAIGFALGAAFWLYLLARRRGPVRDRQAAAVPE
jgi:uncharacterized membrane protein SpoIIM required for sporulation